MVVGVLVVGGCALASAQLVARAGDRVPVLAATRELPAGHVIAAGDVTTVRVAADPQVRLLPATQRGQVIGRTTAVPVTTGGLLAASALGPARVPPAGHSVVGLAVKPGQYPPGLAAGAHVRIITASSASSSPDASVTITGHGQDAKQPTGGGAVRGTVLSMTAARQSTGVAVKVSVQVPTDQAAQVAKAASAGEVSVVQDSSGG